MKNIALVLGVVALLSCPTEGQAIAFELLAGQDKDAGNVLVSQAGGEIVVEILSDYGWTLQETHVTAACAPEDFPMTKCCAPKVGQFLYSQEEYPPGTDEVVVRIPLAGPDSPVLACNLPGDRVYLAVHAVVANPACDKKETAWGGCFCDNPNAPKFYTICGRERGNWAEYFWFVVQ